MYGLLPPYFYGGDTSLEVESAVKVIFEEIIRLNFLKAEDTYEAPLKLGGCSQSQRLNFPGYNLAL